MLRFACKAFSKPSVYNQVLLHKTCGVSFFPCVFSSRYLLIHISLRFLYKLLFTGWISCFRSLRSKVWRRLGKSEMDKALCGGRIFSTSLLVHISCDFCTSLFFTGWISCFRSLGSKVWWRLGKSEMDKALCRYGFFTVFASAHFVAIFVQITFYRMDFLLSFGWEVKFGWRLGKSEMDKAL